MTGIHIGSQCIEVDPPHGRIPQIAEFVVPVRLLPSVDIEEIPPLRHIRTEEQLRILLFQRFAHGLEIERQFPCLPERIVPIYHEPRRALPHILLRIEQVRSARVLLKPQGKPVLLRPQLIETIRPDPVSPVQLLNLSAVEFFQKRPVPADSFLVEAARHDRIPHAAYGNDFLRLPFPCHKTALTAFAVAVHNALHVLLHGASRLFGPVFIPLAGPAVRIYRLFPEDGRAVTYMRIQIVPVHIQQQKVVGQPVCAGAFSHIFLHLYVLAERPCLIALFKIFPGLGIKHHAVEAKLPDQLHRLVDKSLVIVGRAVEIAEDHIDIRPVVCPADHAHTVLFLPGALCNTTQRSRKSSFPYYDFTGSMASIRRSTVVKASPVTVSAQP